MEFHKYGQGRRSVVVICDEALRHKKTHKQFDPNSLVHNTGPLDFAGTAYRVVRTGFKTNDNPMCVVSLFQFTTGQIC